MIIYCNIKNYIKQNNIYLALKMIKYKSYNNFQFFINFNLLIKTFIYRFYNKIANFN